MGPKSSLDTSVVFLFFKCVEDDFSGDTERTSIRLVAFFRILIFLFFLPAVDCDDISSSLFCCSDNEKAGERLNDTEGDVAFWNNTSLFNKRRTLLEFYVVTKKENDSQYCLILHYLGLKKHLHP